MRTSGIDYRSAAYANYRHANSGGPMSRTRKEVISSTLLGNDERFKAALSEVYYHVLIFLKQAKVVFTSKGQMIGCLIRQYIETY